MAIFFWEPSCRWEYSLPPCTTAINGTSATYVNYASAGFASIPVVLATYSAIGTNWFGDNGVIKVHNKTAVGCSIVAGGSFSTNRTVDWFAFGM